MNAISHAAHQSRHQAGAPASAGGRFKSRESPLADAVDLGGGVGKDESPVDSDRIDLLAHEQVCQLLNEAAQVHDQRGSQFFRDAMLGRVASRVDTLAALAGARDRDGFGKQVRDFATAPPEQIARHDERVMQVVTEHMDASGGVSYGDLRAASNDQARSAIDCWVRHRRDPEDWGAAGRLQAALEGAALLSDPHATRDRLDRMYDAGLAYLKQTEDPDASGLLSAFNAG